MEALAGLGISYLLSHLFIFGWKLKTLLDAPSEKDRNIGGLLCSVPVFGLLVLLTLPKQPNPEP